MPEIIVGDRAGKHGRLAVGCSASVIEPGSGRLLLVRRADNGRWAVPGGHMKPGESVAEAAAREVREESGLDVRVMRLAAVYSNPHLLLAYPDGNRWHLVVLHFVAEPVGGALTPGDETTDAGYYAAAAIKTLDLGPFDRQRVADGFAPPGAAIVHDDFRI